MKRGVAAIVVCLALPSAAHAVEWSLYATLREMVEISDNPFLRSPPAAGVGSTTTVTSNLTARTKTSRFDFDADATYRKFWGPAADVGGALAETNDNGLRLHYETYGKIQQDKNWIDAIWRRQSAALAAFDDFGFPANANGDVHTTTIQGGIERAITPTDFWTLSARATSTDYDPPTGGTQYYDFITSSTFRHQSNRTSALTASADLEWLKYDNLTRTNILLARYMAGLDLQFTSTLRLVASAGAATIVAEQREAASIINPSSQTSGVASGFVGNATLTYKFLPTTEFTLNAAQSIGPTVLGAITQRQILAASVRHDVNSLSFLTGIVQVSRQTLANGQTDFFSASATYTRTLVRDLTLNLTYQYLHRGPTDGSVNVFDPITGVPIPPSVQNSGAASANSFFVILSKRFTVLPRRT